MKVVQSPVELTQSVEDIVLGADPEIFVVGPKKGTVIAAFDWLPPKKSPAKYRSATGEGDLYWDGFQAEFTTPATTSLPDHVSNIRAALQRTIELARTYRPQAVLSLDSVKEIERDVLDKTDMKYKEFGCTPSLNIYEICGLPLDGSKVTTRSCGGHLHFGLKNLTNDAVERIVKALDALLAVSCVSFFQKYDKEERRNFYGLVGEYRLPPHGLEYRTLSNAWLADPMIVEIVFDFARNIVRWARDGGVSPVSQKDVIECVLTCNVGMAHKLMEQQKDLILSLCSSEGKQKTIYNAFLEGMETFVPEPRNLEKNWQIGDSNPTKYLAAPPPRGTVTYPYHQNPGNYIG